MLIAFELSMPGKASWNGNWPGEGRPYVRVRVVSKDAAKRILEHPSYDYRWDDGWCASVTARKVDSRDAARLRKKSVGFYGYDWMLDSIIKRGCIMTEREVANA